MQKILDVRIDSVTLKQATETLLQWATGKEKHYATTPNPEILLEANRNKKFLKTLNRSDLNTPDGIGILWAAKFIKIAENGKFIRTKWLLSLLSVAFFPPYVRSELKERVTGVDLMQTMCKKAEKDTLRIFLLGAKHGIAEEVGKILEEKYKKIEVVGTHAGSPKERHEKQIRKLINDSQANTLFVAYGAPKQELWIARNLKKLKTVKLAMGIGGSFDFIAGIQKRSPKWMQKLGIEWLYRLLRQPARIARIYRATVKFPFTILQNRLKTK